MVLLDQKYNSKHEAVIYCLNLVWVNRQLFYHYNYLEYVDPLTLFAAKIIRDLLITSKSDTVCRFITNFEWIYILKPVFHGPDPFQF